MRSAARLVVVTVTAALVAGCGGSDATDDLDDLPSEPGAERSGPPERADADLVIWTGEDPAGLLEQTAEQFADQYGITVAVQVVDGDLQTGFVTANTAGTGPDVVVGAHDWIGNLVQNGATDPLPLSASDQRRYTEAAVEAVTYDGRVHALPYALESVALYRNTDLVPDAPATIEALVASADETGTEHPLCLPVGENGDAYHLHPLYTSAGGYVFGSTPEGGYDASDLGVGKLGSVAAGRKLGELGEQGVLKTSITGDNAIQLFAEGRCPFLVSGPWALADVAAAGFGYAITPVPGFEGLEPAQAFTGVRTFHVASKGRTKTAALQFVLDTVNSPEVMRRFYDAAPRPPAMTEVLEAVTETDADVAAFAEAAELGRLLPALPQMAAVWDPLGQAQAAIISGADPGTTMRNAGQLIADAL